jgi:hypothetical protein
MAKQERRIVQVEKYLLTDFFMASFYSPASFMEGLCFWAHGKYSDNVRASRLYLFA